MFQEAKEKKIQQKEDDSEQWKRRKTEEEKKIVKITTLDPQKDKRKDSESQRSKNESG